MFLNPFPVLGKPTWRRDIFFLCDSPCITCSYRACPYSSTGNSFTNGKLQFYLFGLKNTRALLTALNTYQNFWHVLHRTTVSLPIPVHFRWTAETMWQLTPIEINKETYPTSDSPKGMVRARTSTLSVSPTEHLLVSAEVQLSRAQHRKS